MGITCILPKERARNMECSKKGWGRVQFSETLSLPKMGSSSFLEAKVTQNKASLGH